MTTTVYKNVWKWDSYRQLCELTPGHPARYCLKDEYYLLGDDGSHLSLLGADISQDSLIEFIKGAVGDILIQNSPNDIADNPESSEYRIVQSYPNPFNSSTKISYQLWHDTDVTIDIYDIRGRHIETIIDSRQAAGNHQIIWNAAGNSSGVYF